VAREKSGLGKGLGALIPSASMNQEPSFYSETTGYQEVPIGSISVNPYQPRDVFNEEALNSLSLSIRELGVLQPVLVRRKTADTFELIAGERRWRAAKRAGLENIPSIVRDVEDLTALEHALVENLHRQDLGPLEEAAAYQQLIEDFQLNQELVAKRVGKSRSTITNSLRLLQLPSSVQSFLLDGSITAGHARALLALDSRQDQDQIASRIVEENLSVRDVEKIVREGTSIQKKAPKRSRAKSVSELEVENILSDLLSTRVAVTIGSRKGKIVIDFANEDDLTRILNIIEKQNTQ
jgi:ParB family chromosome partitioning protein